MARVLFVVWKLGDGGAERQLVNLAKGLDQAGHEVVIAVWNAGGAYERELEGSGIRYEVVALPSWPRLPRLIRGLREIAERLRPHVIHGYMESGNFLATLLRSPESGCRIVWGVRASELERTSYDLNGRILYWLNRPLSRLADLVIANSKAGADYVIARNYPHERVAVVHNGIDTGRFRHDPQSGAQLRASWGMSPDERVIGLAARLDPMKDHRNFLAAASSARSGLRRWVCGCAGTATRRICRRSTARSTWRPPLRATLKVFPTRWRRRCPAGFPAW